MTHAIALELAAQRIEHGWCQGRYRDGDSVCATEALNEVTAGGHEHLRIGLYAAVREVIGARGEMISLWNDATVRTQAEVAATFRRAAAAVRTADSVRSRAPVLTLTEFDHAVRSPQLAHQPFRGRE